MARLRKGVAPMIMAKELECLVCGYKWYPTELHPVACAKCRSHPYDDPTKIVECIECGYRWGQRRKRPERTCARCKLVGTWIYLVDLPNKEKIREERADQINQYKKDIYRR